MAKRAASLALGAGAVGTVILDGVREPCTVEVINRVAQETWLTVGNRSSDTPTPAAGADESYYLPGQIGGRVAVQSRYAPVVVKALAAAAGAITAQIVEGG